MNLKDANVGEEYIIKDIVTDDEELNSFLFSLGCYSGEPITVISHLKGGCVVSIKDARYNIDNELECTHIIKRKMNIQNNFSFSFFVCFVVYKAKI